MYFLKYFKKLSLFILCVAFAHSAAFAGNLILKKQLSPAIEEIGSGTFSSVRLCEYNDGTFSRLVAVKKFNDMEDDDNSPENEIKILQSLSHPNIVGYIGTCMTDHNLYLVMEHLDGQTLDTYIKQKPNLSDDSVINIMRQILLGILFIHNHGIIHGDMKPQNLILTDRLIKIIDFGNAQFADSRGRQAPTHSSENPFKGGPYSRLSMKGNKMSSIGTIPYSSPERLAGKEVTTKSDMWSLGCILYELCSGNLLFKPKGNQFSVICDITDYDCSVIPKEIIDRGEKIQQLFKALIVKETVQRASAQEALNILVSDALV